MEECYIATVKIEESDFNRINKLFEIESFDDYTDEQLEEMGAERDHSECVFSAKFENGAVLTYDFCSGGNNYFDDVSVTKDGETITIEDCSYSLDERMEFYAAGVYYIIHVILIKEVHNDYIGGSITKGF